MLGWLTRLVVVLGVVGLVAFDAISVATARMSVEDHASEVARAASSEYQRSQDVQRAYGQALLVASEADPANEVPAEAFTATGDGTVTVHLRRTATTLVLARIGWIADWADVEGSATVREVS